MSAPSSPLAAAIAPPSAIETLVAEAALADPEGACKVCGAGNVPGAQFCADCGGELGRDCPACQRHVGLGDFCEACGCWMHPGKCRFCYAVLSQGAAFCEDCGCNQSGLNCSGCNATSFFDFCGACGSALSERALAAQAAQSADPALSRALAAVADVIQTEPAGAVPERLVQEAQVPGPLGGKAVQDVQGPGPTQVDGGQQLATRAGALPGAPAARQRRLSGNLSRTFQTVWAQQEARLRAAREQLARALEDMGAQTFEDGQQARVHFMSLRQRLIDDGYVPRAWKCNRYSCAHPTPNDCAAPQFGGVWLIEDVNYSADDNS